MKYTLKIIDGTVRHFNSFAEALWNLNEGPQASEYKARPASDFELWFGEQEWYMVLSRSRYLVPTLEGAGTGIELIERLFEEVVHYAIAEDGTIKAPHQMPRRHWEWLSLVGSIAHGVYPGCIPQMPWTSLSDHARRIFQDRLGYGHNGPPLPNGTGTNSRHDVHVAYALARAMPVEADVLYEYRDRSFSSDLRWLPALIQFPVLRGAFPSIGVLESALSIVRLEGLEMTEALAHRVIQACKGLDPDVTRVQVDDALYLAGVVGLKQSSAQRAGDAPEPASDAAQRLSEQLRKCRQQVSLARLKKEREAGQISMRAYLRGQADVEREEAPVSWANEVIKAIESKDLPKVLNVVSNSTNTTTMRFMEKEYGVRLNGQSQRKRSLQACRLVGIQSEEEAQQRLGEIEGQRQQRIKQRDAARAAERVECQDVIFEGQQSNWKAVIDTLIARGYTEIATTPSGAAKKHYLVHPTTREVMLLSAKNGALEYARLAVEAVKESAHAQAAV